MKKLLACLSVLAVLAAFLSPGCDRTKTAATAGAHAFIDCEKQDLAQMVRNDGLTLLGQAISIVQAGGDGWRDALGTLGHKVGDDALACATEAARVALSSGRRFQVSPADGSARASTYIAEHGWQFSP